MTLSQIQIHNVRNIQYAEAELCMTGNLLVGRNGSGKTSFLESIHMLGTGRSFRTGQVESVISEGADSCTVSGLLLKGGVKTRIGVERRRGGKREINLGGSRIQQASMLAEVMPLLVLHAGSLMLIAGAPRFRRNFLNWGVFHTERRFSRLHRDYQNSLRQRNALLRDGKIDKIQLAVWDEKLNSSGRIIDELRRAYVEQFRPIFYQVLGKLKGPDKIELTYNRGWAEDQDFLSVLAKRQATDVQRGQTERGPHRADVTLRRSGIDLNEILSRGEQKLVCWALILAQGQLLSEQKHERGLYLLDDLASELDESARTNVCGVLKDLQGQVFVTSVEEETIKRCWGSNDFRMFHVEHGKVLRSDLR